MQFNNFGGGFDPSKYDNVDFVGNVNVLSANTFQTVLEITGKGYLSALSTILTTTRGKVTIDDVVVFDGVGAIMTKEYYKFDSAGVSKAGVLNGSTSAFTNPDTTALIQKHPYTGQSGAYVILEKPLFFKRSLKIEIRNTTTGNKMLAYKGAVKV